MTKPEKEILKIISVFRDDYYIVLAYPKFRKYDKLIRSGYVSHAGFVAPPGCNERYANGDRKGINRADMVRYKLGRRGRKMFRDQGWIAASR